MNAMDTTTRVKHKAFRQPILEPNVRSAARDLPKWKRYSVLARTWDEILGTRSSRQRVGLQASMLQRQNDAIPKLYPAPDRLENI